MIRMIALDLDGTLAIANHQVSPLTRDALRNLHNGGVEVVIATGRRYRTTRYVIDNLGFEVFAVCNGGALIKTPEQATLHADTFDVTEIASVARNLGLTLFAQRDAHDLGGADFVIDATPRWNEVTAKYHEDNHLHSTRADLIGHAPEFLVCGIFGSEAEVTALADAVQRELPDRYNTIVVRSVQVDGYYCEISQRHVDKWHGISRIHEHLDIHGDHTCAVGDELNDIPMISAAGHGVAMDNAHDELKALAKFVCGHNERDGILDVVDYILDLNSRAPS